MISPTSGWVRCSSQRRSVSLLNTMVRNFARLRLPSSCRTARPKRSAMASRAGLPGATTSRATLSALITVTPCSIKRSAAADFPLPMPPVRPMIRVGVACSVCFIYSCLAAKLCVRANRRLLGWVASTSMRVTLPSPLHYTVISTISAAK